MAAPKARIIVKVERDASASDGNGLMITVRDVDYAGHMLHDRDAYRISYANLKGAEVMRVAANVGAVQTHGSTSADRLAAIQAVVFRDNYIPREFVPKSAQNREPIAPKPPMPAPMPPAPMPVASPDEPKPIVPEPKPEPIKATADDLLSKLGDIGEAIRQAIDAKVPTVDVSSFKTEMDAVRTDIEKTIQEALKETRRIEIDVRTIAGVNPLPTTHHAMLPKVIRIVSVEDGHVFLVGPAGTGKSTIGVQAANALGLKLYSISFGPTTPTSKIFGFMDANKNYQRTPFRDAYEYGGIFLGDELDNGHPGLIAELNQALANSECAFADGMVKRHPDFRMIATGNTYGKGADRLFIGRNMLDAATLDRFITVDIETDEKLERAVALGNATDETREETDKWVTSVQQWRKNAQLAKVPVVISPRASIIGARLIAIGFTMSEVAEMKVFAGMSADVRTKVEGR